MSNGHSLGRRSGRGIQSVAHPSQTCAGGFSYPQLVNDIRLICGQLNVVAMDNVELNPGLDPTGRSTALACKFLRECLLAL